MLHLYDAIYIHKFVASVISLVWMFAGCQGPPKKAQGPPTTTSSIRSNVINFMILSVTFSLFCDVVMINYKYSYGIVQIPRLPVAWFIAIIGRPIFDGYSRCFQMCLNVLVLFSFIFKGAAINLLCGTWNFVYRTPISRRKLNCPSSIERIIFIIWTVFFHILGLSILQFSLSEDFLLSSLVPLLAIQVHQIYLIILTLSSISNIKKFSSKCLERISEERNMEATVILRPIDSPSSKTMKDSFMLHLEITKRQLSCLVISLFFETTSAVLIILGGLYAGDGNIFGLLPQSKLILDSLSCIYILSSLIAVIIPVNIMNSYIV